MNTIRLGRESMKQITNLNKRNELLNNIQVELKKNRNIHIYYGGKRISIYEIKTRHNFFGGILTIFLTVGSVIFSNIIFWIN